MARVHILINGKPPCNVEKVAAASGFEYKTTTAVAAVTCKACLAHIKEYGLKEPKQAADDDFTIDQLIGLTINKAKVVALRKGTGLRTFRVVAEDGEKYDTFDPIKRVRLDRVNCECVNDVVIKVSLG